MITKNDGLGYGQTWQAVARISGITYYNYTGKPIALKVGVQSGGVTSGTLTIGSMTVQMNVNISSNYAPFIVPPGVAYSFTGAVDIGFELR